MSVFFVHYWAPQNISENYDSFNFLRVANARDKNSNSAYREHNSWCYRRRIWIEGAWYFNTAIKRSLRLFQTHVNFARDTFAEIKKYTFEMQIRMAPRTATSSSRIL